MKVKIFPCLMERSSVSDWIQIIVAVAGTPIETQWSQVTTLEKFEENITKNERSALFFLNLCLGSFPKRTFGDSKTTHGNYTS